MNKLLLSALLFIQSFAFACDVKISTAVEAVAGGLNAQVRARNIGPSACGRVQILVGTQTDEGVPNLVDFASESGGVCLSDSPGLVCYSAFNGMPVGAQYVINVAVRTATITSTSGCFTAEAQSLQDGNAANDVARGCLTDVAANACVVVDSFTVSGAAESRVTRLLMRNACKETVNVRNAPANALDVASVPVDVYPTAGAIVGGITADLRGYLLDLVVTGGARFVLEAPAGAGCAPLDLGGSAELVCF